MRSPSRSNACPKGNDSRPVFSPSGSVIRCASTEVLVNRSLVVRAPTARTAREEPMLADAIAGTFSAPLVVVQAAGQNPDVARALQEARAAQQEAVQQAAQAQRDA